jgi:hypothetical protein
MDEIIKGTPLPSWPDQEILRQMFQPIRRKIRRKVALQYCQSCGLAFLAPTAERCQCSVRRPKRQA